jgi:hypothetical protein
MTKNGLFLIKPTSVDAIGSGSSATISANGSVTFSSCQAVGINGVFNNDYDNYICLLRDSGSATVLYRFRMRSSGVDDASANYTQQYFYSIGSSTPASRSTGLTSGEFAYSTNRSGAFGTFYGPALAQKTITRTIAVEAVDYLYLKNYAILHNVVDSYDGFTLFPPSGTCSGYAAVYGVRK